jgi:chemotaxis protein CheD
MNGAGHKLPVFYLKPGELHIADRPGIVTTVLGSCLSVTMFNGRLKTGAICHGMLPRWVEKQGCGSQCLEVFKYVDYSVQYMIDHFRSLGVQPHEIEVKLFGGADMFAYGGSGREAVSVGRQNIVTALHVIERERLNIHSKDIGGSQGRKLHFYLHTGVVLMKKLKASYNEKN